MPVPRSTLLPASLPARMPATPLTRCTCLQGDINVPRVVQSTVQQLPTLARQLALGWSDRVLAS